MTPTCEVVADRPDGLDAVVRAVTSDPAALAAAGLDRGGARRQGFTGKAGQVLLRAGAGAGDSDGADTGPLEAVVGLGPPDEAGREAARRAAAAAVRALPGCRSVAFEVAGFGPTLAGEVAARAVVEGALLALDRLDDFRSAPEDPPAIERLVVLAGAAQPLAAATDAVRRGEVVAEAVRQARRLVNTPPSDATPRAIAEEAVATAEREGLEVRVLDEDDLRAERLGGLLAVARGSAEPPRLVRLAYRPDAPTATVALVGKGITFDSGGLSLKPPASMTTMKYDMSGAAAVLGALGACRRLGVGAEVVGFLALTENMPGGRAVKPGDVFTARNGTTVEVLNTDAEGRLVLADALSLAAEEAPDAIVDLATLTGAAVTALGKSVAGLLGNDERLLAAVGEAGRVAGEPSWTLPLPPFYRKLLDSNVADLANIGPAGQAGTVVAGLFLERFVGDRPWAHLDIAGPAYADDTSGYRNKGATGFGVATLLALLEAYQPIGGPASAPTASRAVPA